MDPKPSGDSPERPAPVFLLVDEDEEARARLTARLPAEWIFVPIQRPYQVLDYARRLRPTAVVLAESDHGSGGAGRRLLGHLSKDLGLPVILLVEGWDPDLAAAWIRAGAHSCLPHPTRYQQRLGKLRDLLHDFAMGPAESAGPGPELRAFLDPRNSP